MPSKAKPNRTCDIGMMMKRAGLDLAVLSFVNSKIEVREVSGRGRGVFAKRAIKKGEVVTTSAGVGLPLSAVKRLPKEWQTYCYYTENGFFYCP